MNPFLTWMVAAWLCAGYLASAAPFLEQTNLFEAGVGGYALYRVPGIVATKTGALLVFVDARNTGSDWGEIDIFMRRSLDRGATWRAPVKIITPPRDVAGLANPVGDAHRGVREGLATNGVKQGGLTIHNQTPIAGRDGTVHLLYGIECARCYYMKSLDDGATWSEPVDITSVIEGFRPSYPWKVMATGPGHGIQTSRGRLIVPIWLSRSLYGGGHRPSVTATIYSDDNGRTWQCGGIIANETDPLRNPNEMTVVELRHGRIMANLRHESVLHCRAVSDSMDGIGHWTTPRFDLQLRDPICFGSLASLGEGRILFSNADNLDRADGKKAEFRDRKRLSIKLSENDGASWAFNRVIEPGASGYSDLAVDDKNTIYCVYERGLADGNLTHNRFITLARFHEDWVREGGKPPICSLEEAKIAPPR